MTASLNSLLFSATTPVVEFDGRFFIAAGQCGFNCRTNNRGGFATEAKALAAIARFTRSAA